MTDAIVPREDTRGRIQAVALELFTEQGYDKTSLREIAERLGVTKAALYYHFKSKEEIVESLTSDHLTRVEALLAWAREQPFTPEFRREFLRRYSADLSVSRHFKVMKFFQQNQPALKDMPNAGKWRESMRQIIDTLTGTEADAARRMRIGLAFFGLHVSYMMLPEDSYSEEERREAALATAYELVAEKS